MSTDVLILGAGPAGAALARQLALAGFKVVLTDRAAFPRSKPCGEFLSPQCTPYLVALGLPSLLADTGAFAVRGLQLGGFGAQATGHFAPLHHAKYEEGVNGTPETGLFDPRHLAGR